MVRRAMALGVWLLAILPACGGNVEGGGSPDSDPVSDPAAPDDSGSGNVPIEGDTALGDCTLGPRVSRLEACAWVAAERCYATREMACNCVCPRERDSQCVSGFDDGPDGRVAVSCH